ncbi:unnamed protein product [Adineta ricciae]|uniref:Uncharacterized protein n=1 Tax=Adineta ricciae TaxID=249248 RepID=A0A815W333_ADIRI|nr:unnamed protein product [Adineta ricciae]
MAIEDNKIFAGDTRAGPPGSGSAQAPTVSIQSRLGDVEAGLDALRKEVKAGFLAVKDAQEGLDSKLDNLLSLMKDHMNSIVLSGVNRRKPSRKLSQMLRGIIDGERNMKSMRLLVLVSSGEGKPREIDIRTTVYENEDFIYQRHVKSSRTFLSEVEKRFILMAFTL